jgi:hypothetical protein
MYYENNQENTSLLRNEQGIERREINQSSSVVQNSEIEEKTTTVVQNVEVKEEVIEVIESKLPEDNPEAIDIQEVTKVQGGFVYAEEAQEYLAELRLKDAILGRSMVIRAIYIGIFLSIVNMTIAIAMTVAFSGYVGILIGFSAFSLAVFASGIYIVNTFVASCDEAIKSNNVAKCESVDQSWERTLLNVWLYCVMTVFLIFLVLTIACFVYQTDIKMAIEAGHRTPETWTKYFGDRTFEYVYGNVSGFMFLVGSFALVLTIYCAVLLAYAFRLIGEYRTIQTIMEYICVVFFILGFIFTYLAVYAIKYKNVAKVDKAMPSWVPNVLLVVASVSIIVAIIGYTATYMENARYLKYYGLGTLGFTLCIFICASGGFYFSNNFDKLFDGHCSSIMDLINEDYVINSIGCEKKYSFMKPELEDMNCPKDRIVQAWETNLGKNVEDQTEVFGCLDSNCCYTTFSSVKGRIDFMALITMILFVFAACLTIGSYVMWDRLYRRIERGEGQQAMSKSLIIVVACVAVFMIIFILLIPNPPPISPSEDIVVDPAPEDNTYVDVEDVVVDTTTAIVLEEKKNEVIIKGETKIVEIMTNCVNKSCPKMKYYYDLVSDDGNLIFTSSGSSSSNLKLIAMKKEANGEYWLKYSGNSASLNEFVSAYEFAAICPLKKNAVRLKVSTEAMPVDAVFLQTNIRNLLKQAPADATTPGATDATPTATTTSSSTTTTSSSSSSSSSTTEMQTYTIDPSKMTVGEKQNVFDKLLDYSMVSKNSVTIKGKVTQVKNNTTQPVQGAKVVLASADFAGCQPLTFTTNVNGEFTTSAIPLLEGDLPSDYNLEISANDLSTYKKKVTIGGLGFSKVEDVGEISLWSTKITQFTSVSSKIISSINNKAIDGVTITLYKGYIEFHNEVEGSEQTNALQGSKVISNSKGEYGFKDLEPGTYTLVFEKEGFYREVRRNLIF